MQQHQTVRDHLIVFRTRSVWRMHRKTAARWSQLKWAWSIWRVKVIGKQVHTLSSATILLWIPCLAYATTYGNDHVWVKYRRNFKGQYAPETRKTCIVSGCGQCIKDNILLNSIYPTRDKKDYRLVTPAPSAGMNIWSWITGMLIFWNSSSRHIMELSSKQSKTL